MSSRRSMSDRNVAIRSCTSAFMRGRAAASLVDSHATIACNCFCAACVASAQSFCTCSDAAATSSSISTLTQNTHSQQASRRKRRRSSSTLKHESNKSNLSLLKMPRPSLDSIPGGSPPGLPGNPYRNEWESILIHSPISSIRRLLHFRGYCIFRLCHFRGYFIFRSDRFMDQYFF